MPTVCRSCQAPLEFPLGCARCGSLFTPPPGLSPFEILGLQRSARVDATALKKRLTKLSRVVHPDFFAAAEPAARALAERHSAELNRAYEILADDALRAATLLDELGAPNERQRGPLAPSFLAQALEWNERLDELAGAPRDEREHALAKLEAELEAKKRSGLERVLASLDPLPPHSAAVLAEARTTLDELRYVDRALERAAALRNAPARAEQEAR